MADLESKQKRLGARALHRRFGQMLSARSDASILAEHFQFIRDNDADVAAARQGGDAAWAVRFAQRYYTKLSKTYVLVSLARAGEGKVGMRWRTPKEVVAGRGHFTCGGLECDAVSGLVSLEVPFSYKEAGRSKDALVTARLCPLCTQAMLAARPPSSRTTARRREALLAGVAGGRKRGREGGEAREGEEGAAAAAKQPAVQEAGSPDPTAPMRRGKSRSPSHSSAGGSLAGLSDEALLRRLLL